MNKNNRILQWWWSRQGLSGLPESTGWFTVEHRGTKQTAQLAPGRIYFRPEDSKFIPADLKALIVAVSDMSYC